MGRCHGCSHARIGSIEMKGACLEARATAIARSQSFLSPLFIWRSIWEEFIPRKRENYHEALEKNLCERMDRNRVNVEDLYEISTGRYGVMRLIALWYISERIFQGRYPRFSMIKDAVAHRVGSARTVDKVLAGIVSPPELATRGFGWFVTRSKKDVTHKTCDDDKVPYVVCANPSVLRNVFSIMNTAIVVGNIVKSEDSVLKLKKDILSRLKRGATDQEILEFLNKPQGRSLVMDISNLIRENLRKTGFIDKWVDSMKVERLREKDDPKPMFWNYESFRLDSPQEMIAIPDVMPLLKDSLRLHATKAWDRQGNE